MSFRGTSLVSSNGSQAAIRGPISCLGLTFERPSRAIGGLTAWRTRSFSVGRVVSCQTDPAKGLFQGGVIGPDVAGLP